MTGIPAHRSLFPGPALLIALALGNALLLAPAGSLPRVCGAGIILLLPGLAWAQRLCGPTDRLTRWMVGAGLSYTLAMVLGLVLHYLPGPISLWAELAALNVLVLIPSLGAGGWRLEARRSTLHAPRSTLHAPRSTLVLMLILVLAALFRFASLGYSEFQGDEALAMISAAEALEGHQDALFLRGKGPGEVLLPMALWRLTGTIHETIARLPFTFAGVFLVLTTYCLGRRLLSEERRLSQQAALLAAGLLALNGFMVGFSRIVQYQALVVWMSGLALLCAWQSRTDRGYSARWAALAGAFLGAGLLAHYDALLVLPALVYIKTSNFKFQISNFKYPLSNLLVATANLLLVAGLFYLPYALDPQAARTGTYLGDRIGQGLLKNNLDSFLHFNSFYSSFYYVMLTGLLLLGFLAWAIGRAPGVERIPGGRYGLPALAVLAVLGLMVRPDALRIRGLDLAALPFALILLGAFISSALSPGQRSVVVWLAVPFLGYNFAVALPLTHIYTIIPAWTLLAGLSAAGLLSKSQISNGKYQIPNPSPRLSVTGYLLPVTCYLLPAILFSGYLFIAYLRQAPEFWQDWPASQPGLYWSPYSELPPAGFFGFAHRSGWKTVGALYAQGALQGDYGSNEEPDVTTWYTRGAPRACDPQPEYYLIADDLVDPWPADMAGGETDYTAIGRAALPNGKGLTIYQVTPTSDDLGNLPADALAYAFDGTATPAAFARSARGSQAAQVNLGSLTQLIGYDVDTRRARPGGRVAVTLYWQAQAPIPQDYHVFVHLEGDASTGSTPGIWGQADGRPVCWTYPTFDWRPGQIIADQHALYIKPDIPRGDYALLVGMYRPDTGARLDVLDETGNPVANFVKLTTVAIRQ